jgi:hypothetical protein
MQPGLPFTSRLPQDWQSVDATAKNCGDESASQVNLPLLPFAGDRGIGGSTAGRMQFDKGSAEDRKFNRHLVSVAAPSTHRQSGISANFPRLPKDLAILPCPRRTRRSA